MPGNGENTVISEQRTEIKAGIQLRTSVKPHDLLVVGQITDQYLRRSSTLIQITTRSRRILPVMKNTAIGLRQSARIKLGHQAWVIRWQSTQALRIDCKMKRSGEIG